MFDRVAELLEMGRFRGFLPTPTWNSERERTFCRTVTGELERAARSGGNIDSSGVISQLMEFHHAREGDNLNWFVTALAIAGIIESCEYASSMDTDFMMWGVASVYRMNNADDDEEDDEQELRRIEAKVRVRRHLGPFQDEVNEALAALPELRKRVERENTIFPMFKEVLDTFPANMVGGDSLFARPRNASKHLIERVYRAIRLHHVEEGEFISFRDLTADLDLDIRSCQYPLAYYTWVKTHELYRTISAEMDRVFAATKEECK